MIEQVVLPEYGWECVESEMHTINSALDGKSIGEEFVAFTPRAARAASTMKSLRISDAILENCQEWAREASVTEIDFTYGVLYGTKKQSNKKDWHICEISTTRRR